MKIGNLRKPFLATMLMLCCAAGTQGRTVREALDVLLATTYCPTASADGMGMASALRGETPVSDDGVFDVPQEEWLPVLLEMASEELEACKRDTADDIAGIRRWEAAGEKRDNSEDEGTLFLWEAYRRVKSRVHKLRKMAECLLFVDGETGPVLDMLERIGLESPPEFDLSHRVAVSMVRKACRDGQFSRCLELGRHYRALHGPGSQQELDICRELGNYGLPVLAAEADRTECIRYMLGVAEALENVYLARAFDEMAKGAVPGWGGSLQRRRLAARFPDEPIPRFQYYYPDTKETVEGEIIESMVPMMLNRQAAAELAADESELTDLREVYGDWTTEKDDE